MLKKTIGLSHLLRKQNSQLQELSYAYDHSSAVGIFWLPVQLQLNLHQCYVFPQLHNVLLLLTVVKALIVWLPMIRLRAL